MPSDAQNFWNFSLDLYDREGVALWCLELQDKYQLDVNLLLFCFWHAYSYGKLDQALLQKIIAFSNNWRAEVVQPLRNSRQWMKLQSDPRSEFEELRERIKADELLAEKFQQDQLEYLSRDFNRERQYLPNVACIDENIDLLLQGLEIEKDEKIMENVGFIRSALTR